MIFKNCVIAAYYVKYSHIEDFIKWAIIEYKDFYWVNFKYKVFPIISVIADFEEFYTDIYAIVTFEMNESSRCYIDYVDYLDEDLWKASMELSGFEIRTNIQYWDKTIFRKLKLKQIINI